MPCTRPRRPFKSPNSAPANSSGASISTPHHRLQQRRLCLLHALPKRQPRRHLERHLARIHIVVTTIEDRHLQIHHGYPAKKPRPATHERPSPPQAHTDAGSTPQRSRSQTPLRLRAAAPPSESCSRHTVHGRQSASYIAPAPRPSHESFPDTESSAPFNVTSVWYRRFNLDTTASICCCPAPATKNSFVCGSRKNLTIGSSSITLWSAGASLSSSARDLGSIAYVIAGSGIGTGSR